MDGLIDQTAAGTGNLVGVEPARRMPVVLQHGDIGRLLLAHELRERDARQERENMIVEARPQIVRHAAAIVLAVLAAAALRGVDGFVDGDDDVGDRKLVGGLRKVVSAARPAHALDQPRTAQLAEQLLEIRK